MSPVSTPVLRGIMYMTGASACYAIVYVTIRTLSQDLPVAELVFFRALIGVALALPWIAKNGIAALATSQWRLYLVRAALVFTGMLTWFYGLKMLPLTDATALIFTIPLFTFLLAVLWLGEKAGIHRWSALFVGFIGVLIIIRPGIIPISLAAVGVLYTAAAYGASNIYTKILTRTEPIGRLVFYMFLSLLVLSAIPTTIGWITPTWSHLPWIIGMGIVSYVAQQCITRAFAAGDATVIAPFGFLQLPFVAVLAMVLYDEGSDAATWGGALIIFISTSYITRREAMAARRTAANPKG